MALVLAAALNPVAALAAPRTAGTQSPHVDTQAAKTTVYVIASKKSTWGGTSSQTTKYTYNKSGLVAKVKDQTGTAKLKYKKGLLVKRTDRFTTQTFSYDAKGCLKKRTSTLNSKAVEPHKMMTIYAIKSGKISKAKITWVDLSGKKHDPDTLKYTYSKNLPTRVGDSTYKYDAKKNIKKFSTNGGSPWSYKNTYGKHNLLKKSVGTSGSTTRTMTYTYKKLKVTKAQAEKVKTQQWAIINEDLNVALGEGR